jgi:exodeoxyribonuclease V alpha subunit
MALDDNDELGERPGDDEEPQGPIQTNKGTVKRVAWESPGNSFKILKVEVTEEGGPFGKGRRASTKLESWKGDVGIDVGVGSVLEVEGWWQPSDRFDPTFIVTLLRSNTPYSIDGMRMWLMRRLPNIGEARASALAEKFPGELLFSVIQDDPEQLTAVSGITSERAQEIKKTYEKYKHERIPVSELVNLGIDFRLASDAVEQLGIEGLKRTLRENPFELVDLPGWSFKMVKLFIERKDNPNGMEQKDLRFIQAYVREFLERLQEGDSDLRELITGVMENRKMTRDEKYRPVWGRDGGDCFLDRDYAVSALKPFTKFGYSMKELGEILSKSKYLKIRTNALLLADIDAAEVNVARVLREKALHEVEVRPVSFDQPDRPPLDESQKAAAEALVFSKLVVMTGGPGTGKTTTLRAALNAMGEEKIVLAAPTGKAARRMTEATGRPATTIHRLLEWTPDGFRRDESNPIEADVIVLDETSMLDINLASAFFSAVGGARVILVGDKDQLPPVGPGQVLTDILKAKIDGESALPVYQLTKTHRQAGENWVIENARRIINGQLPSLAPVTSPNGDFRFEEASSSREIIEKIIRAYEIARSNGYIKQMQVLAPVRKKGVGASAYEINLAVQKKLNPRSLNEKDGISGGDGYKIHIGDKVMYTKNSPKLGLVNGSMGWVEDIDREDSSIQSTFALVRIDGQENPERADGLYMLKGEHFRALWLAYGMSIHKSQGSEWPFVFVVMDPSHGRLLRRQVLYTAVTRTSRNLVLVGARQAVETASTSAMQNERWTKLTERILGLPV